MRKGGGKTCVGGSERKSGEEKGLFFRPYYHLRQGLASFSFPLPPFLFFPDAPRKEKKKGVFFLLPPFFSTSWLLINCSSFLWLPFFPGAFPSQQQSYAAQTKIEPSPFILPPHAFPLSHTWLEARGLGEGGDGGSLYLQDSS